MKPEQDVVRRRFTKRKLISEGKKRLAASKKSSKYTETAKAAAEKFVKDYEKKHEVKLEYSMDDVRILDRELEKNFENNTLTTEEIVCMGYFLGEILRRNVGGDYEFREEQNVVALKCLEIAAFPILKIKKALEEKRKGSLEGYVFLYAKKVSDKKSSK